MRTITTFESHFNSNTFIFHLLLLNVTDEQHAGKRRYKWIAFLLYIQI